MHASHTQRTPRSLTCIDQVAGFSSTVVPHEVQLTDSCSSVTLGVSPHQRVHASPFAVPGHQAWYDGWAGEDGVAAVPLWDD